MTLEIDTQKQFVISQLSPRAEGAQYKEVIRDVMKDFLVVLRIFWYYVSLLGVQPNNQC